MLEKSIKNEQIQRLPVFVFLFSKKTADIKNISVTAVYLWHLTVPLFDQHLFKNFWCQLFSKNRIRISFTLSLNYLGLSFCLSLLLLLLSCFDFFLSYCFIRNRLLNCFTSIDILYRYSLKSNTFSSKLFLKN